jgi:small subunit ribosomal protein S4
MARYTGPRSKIARKFRDPIFGPDKTLAKKNYPPGMHGPSKRKRKQSEYAVQLSEKQKAKYTYGILERQFRKMFEKAAAMKGITGESLLMLCEARLDNVVYRLGISNTRAGARQLVSHKHIQVNGNTVNVPSYHLRSGDKVSIREKSKSLVVIAASLGSTNMKYDWLSWDNNTMTGTFISAPHREQIPENIKEQLIVELYNK